MTDQLSGIANYCFRWCERCPFTDRCGVYSLGRELGAEGRQQNTMPRAFPALSGSYADFLRRLEKQLMVDGVSLQELETDPPLPVAEIKSRSRSMVIEYLSASQWTRPLLQSANFDDPSVQAAHALNWYVVMLGPKVQRCLHSREETTEQGDGFFYEDARRTAYLTLLCLARATAAVTVLLERSVSPRSRLVGLVVQFIRLTESIRRVFPDVSLYPPPHWDQEPYLSEQLAFYGGVLPLHPFLEGMWRYGGERAPGGG
ncbi:hypothetical protein CLV84_1129 [Neolewinella xylanilytica]|uniref:Uncharacterized protein n=1 Tax=Neolewinella xylanilytica TaxID=1514080 RepID=A0A2S6I9I8_9BACT|nr:hypothetical protein [Neolewinella xylanilytica]PPK88164.1 hypothetical protein CLV84_1129 [Neolewinella xylanilytica]